MPSTREREMLVIRYPRGLDAGPRRVEVTSLGMRKLKEGRSTGS